MAVTRAKSPPPPRRAQNSSASDSAVTRFAVPSASTTSIARTLLAASPCRLPNQLRPPPRVYPVTLTTGELPARPVSPCLPASASTSPQDAPASTRASLRSGHTRTPPIRPVRTRISPSRPSEAPWPLGWTATPKPCRLA